MVQWIKAQSANAHLSAIKATLIADTGLKLWHRGYRKTEIRNDEEYMAFRAALESETAPTGEPWLP